MTHDKLVTSFLIAALLLAVALLIIVIRCPI
jgi:hypothetical protein